MTVLEAPGRESGRAGEDGRARRRWPFGAGAAVRLPVAAWAVGAWACTLPVAMALPGLAGDAAGPFTLRGTMLPLVAGALLLAAALAAGLWRASDALVAASAGLFASWTALVMRAALHGTPFGFNGLYGDMARMTAMATRYGVTAFSSDGIVAGVPSEYPLLYPWLVGRTAALTGVPAWRLLGDAEVLVTSATVVAAFLLWRRLVPPGLALVLALAGLAVFHDPWKAFEVLALAVTVPWLLAAFAGPPRGRLHWLPAGVIGGLILLTYHGYLIYSAAGIAALVAIGWHGAPDRRAHLAHAGRTAGLAALIASPYLVPYGAALLSGGQVVADHFGAWAIALNPFPFLRPSFAGLLQLAGLAGLVWYRRAAWWAPPLTALVLGTYFYRLSCAVRYLLTGHTGMIHHAAVMTDALLVLAGVLTAARALPGLGRRLRAVPPRGLGALGLACAAAWTGATCYEAWMPGSAGRAAVRAAGTSPVARAHAEPAPDGRRDFPRALPGQGRFPVEQVRAAVESRLGRGARPRTLAYDERLFSYLPWRGYIAVDRTAALTPTRWDDRFAALRALAASGDAAAFARRSAATPFGPIDVFVLRNENAGRVWTWRPLHHKPAVRFTPLNFTPDRWDVTRAGRETVVAVRRAGR
ncbi:MULTISPECIES: arabinofuranosyltransferase [Actinomadura]|uniref:Arabinofuranosyltransferase n=1 Tax=Actinomadura yumaensis TaxID=111807 RepID=A0ABW2CRB5_9ACTN|nr:arabinofuranosyltransferase [Actinomadura sp. J1-007]MWK36000.1 hypothetical protein [Actinomadura sp. J1-007]